jgi:Fic family protein
MYIWELNGWPCFTWDAAALAPLLAGVHRGQGRLTGRMEGLGFALRDDAKLRVFTEDVVRSSEIEGQTLNAEAVRSSIARKLGIDIGGLKPTDRDIEGIVDVILDATTRFAEPLTVERLQGWHTSLFPAGRSGLSRIETGEWRTAESGPMQVVSGTLGREVVHFEAPPSTIIDDEIGRFLEWYEREDELFPVIDAGLAHLWFVTIHPFEDGNGRIGRAILDMALARSENSSQRFYSLSRQIEDERREYYRILEQTQQGSLDVTAYLIWYLGCLVRALDGAHELLADVLRKARFWERFASESLNRRQVQVINRLLDGFEGKLTSSKWARMTRTSQDTAFRDIVNLIERGILVKNPGGGRSTSYSLVDKKD